MSREIGSDGLETVSPETVCRYRDSLSVQRQSVSRSTDCQSVGPETVGPKSVGRLVQIQAVGRFRDSQSVGPETVCQLVQSRPVGPETVGPETVSPKTVGPETVGLETDGPETVGPESDRQTDRQTDCLWQRQTVSGRDSLSRNCRSRDTNRSFDCLLIPRVRLDEPDIPNLKL